MLLLFQLPYFSGYKTGFFFVPLTSNNKISPMKVCYNTNLPFLNHPKDLDLSYKTDLDLWGCFGRKIIPSYNRKNTVPAVKNRVARVREKHLEHDFYPSSGKSQ